MDVFELLSDCSSFDERFISLKGLPGMLSAKGEINRIYNSWSGFDEDFVKQFQTLNFEARLWELYCYEFFKDQEFVVEPCNENRPDFSLLKNGREIVVESVTSNESGKRTKQIYLNTLEREDRIDFKTRIGSALFSKLNKEYHKLEWVKNKPLIIAIQPYHSAESFNMNVYTMVSYLYGIDISKEKLANGEILTRFLKGKNFKRNHNGEVIEIDAYFNLEMSKYISGVLFTNTATLGKFSRMGYQNGFGVDDTLGIIYTGACYAENEIEPRQFSINIGKTGFDNYRYGVTLFHNPNAICPINDEDFMCTQVKFINNEIYWKRLGFYPYSGKNIRLIRNLSREGKKINNSFLGNNAFNEEE